MGEVFCMRCLSHNYVKCLYDPLTALAVTATALSVGGGLYSGAQQNKAAKQSAAAQEEQANLALEEASVNAGIVADDRRNFLKRQTLAFTKSGVALEGSPLLVLETTRAKSQQEVDAIIKSGNAQYKLGMANAQTTRNTGRAALIGSMVSAAGTIGSTALGAKSAGLFNSSTTNAANTRKS